MLRLPSLLRPRSRQLSLLSVILLGAILLAVACANSAGPPSSGFNAGGSGSGGNSGSGGSGGNSGNGGGAAGTSSLSGGSGGKNGTLTIPPALSNNGDAGACDGGLCGDFPSTPVIDTTLTAADPPVAPNAGSLFGASTGGNGTDGPCLAEPADGALYPYNWLRPRVLWTPGTKAQNLFEVRFHASVEQNDLVVYTTHNYWTLDIATWQTIAGVEGGNAGTLIGQPIAVTVRAMAGTTGTPAISNTATITIAPAIADGSLIYWTTASFDANAATTTLQGFHVGDEGTTPALTVAQVQQTVWAGPPDGGNFPTTYPIPPEPVGCIGCHTATPDGNYVAFTAQWPWPNAIASVQADGGAPVGAAPPWLTPSAIDNLGPNTNDANWAGPAKTGNYGPSNNVDAIMLGIQTFSKAHYRTGDRVEVTTVGAALDSPVPTTELPTGVVSKLIWVDLEFTGATDGGRPSALTGAPNNGGWGVIATGDTNSAGAPDWSHDGNSIAYTSVNGGTEDGRLAKPASGSADVKVVPYTDRVGGTAMGLPGASDPAYNEYFPAFSPDDSLIAFNRVVAADTMYNQPLAEVFVVPFNGGKGGTAVRLAANDPVACTAHTSPGVQNTWPKWAPNPAPPPDAGAAPGTTAPQTINGLTYYWLTFSSTRSPTAGGKEQLYVAGVIVDGTGAITTYAPIYLWNQSDQVNNLIPAWGAFSIPPGKEPPPPPPAPIPPR
jgi:hypothetical protein